MSNSRRPRFASVLLRVAESLLATSLAYADIDIVLKNDFIEKYKNRTSIDAQFTVGVASKIHPAKDDGDIHIAGQSDDVGLPVVAEIMNAKDESQTISAVRAAEVSKAPAPVSGAWRIWCEHGGGDNQVQGDPVEIPTTSNPDHIFEIHPVTSFAGRSVLKSLHPISGYDPKDAHDAFVRYENIRSVITPSASTTTIRTAMAGYNYVEFIMEIDGEQKEVDDGRFVFAKVFDTDCELLIRKRRMVFLKDSPPEKKLKTLTSGKQLRVLGMPRVDLALVSWRAQCAKDSTCLAKFPEVLQWTLPYEIIVVGLAGTANCQEP